MTKLNQLIAVRKGIQSKFERYETELHHMVQKPALLNGINKTYVPKDEEGDHLPSESTRVQLSVAVALTELAKAATRLYDVTLTQESANGEARADVVVDGVPLLLDVPVTYLLFLEKQLVNLSTFVAKLPILDPAQVWTFDEDNRIYRADPVSSVRSKKVPKAFVKYDATDKHPAQVEVFQDELLMGTWTKVDTSGAIPAARRGDLLARIDKLSQAVKYAREEANNLEVTDRHAAEAVFGFLFS